MNKIKNLLDSKPFQNILFGIIEGIFIFSGIYLLIIIYIRKNEKKKLIQQLITNFNIYSPFLLQKTVENKLINELDDIIKKLEKKKKKEEIRIKKENKKYYRNFNTGFILFTVFIFLILSIKIAFSFNKKFLNKLLTEFIIIILSALVVVLVEFIFFKNIIMDYWLVDFGNIIKKFLKTYKIYFMIDTNTNTNKQL